MAAPGLPTVPPAEARGWVTPEELNVAPALLGLPLARPRQRLAAMAIDIALIALVHRVANGWLLLGGAVLLAAHLLAQRRGPSARRRLVAALLAVPLIGLGLRAAVVDLRDGRHPVPRLSVTSTDDDEDDRDVAAGAAALKAAAQSASGAEGRVAMRERALKAGLALAQAQLAAREAEIAALKAAAAVAAASQAGMPAASGPSAPAPAPAPASAGATLSRWRAAIEHAADALGLGYGWSILYFTLLPAWGAGRSPGKRLLGLRVCELTGKPMTAMLALRRYGGYAAGVATGGLGLLQLLWDPNRQAIQDKTAHTVVVDERRPRRAPPAPAPAQAAEAALNLTAPPTTTPPR
jgi:uncharacterized RDD family membrane protein YckC